MYVCVFKRKINSDRERGREGGRWTIVSISCKLTYLPELLHIHNIRLYRLVIKLSLVFSLRIIKPVG